MLTKSLARVQIKDADQGLVTAVFSVFGNVDSDGDVMVKGAFEDGAPVVVSAYGHRSWDGDLPVGKGVIRQTDTHGEADLRFFLDTTHGRDAFAVVKELAADDLQEWSFSLEDVQAERGEVNGKSVRLIKKVKVKEVSPVLRGANPATRTLAVKALDATGLKFSEHAATVLADVDALIARASEVVALRAEKGKTIAEESADLLKQLDVALDRLKAVVAPATPDTSVDDLQAAFEAEFLRFVATSQGAPT